MGNQLGAVRSGKFHRERDLGQAADLAHALTEADKRVAVLRDQTCRQADRCLRLYWNPRELAEAMGLSPDVLRSRLARWRKRPRTAETVDVS